MTSAMLDFYPLVMESIRIQPEPQRKAHEDAKEKGEIFVGVAAGIHNREMYTELIKAQVKVSRNGSNVRSIADDRLWLSSPTCCVGRLIMTLSIILISSRRLALGCSKIVLQRM